MGFPVACDIGVVAEPARQGALRARPAQRTQNLAGCLAPVRLNAEHVLDFAHSGAEVRTELFTGADMAIAVARHARQAEAMFSPRNGTIGVVLLALLAAVGCESDPARSPVGAPTEPVPEDTPQVGGQTGTEGGCVGSLEPAEQSAPLSPEEVRALIVGHHETTLAYRDFLRTVDDAVESEPGTSLTVDLVALGSLHTPSTEVGSECRGGGGVDQLFEVRLRGGEPPVEVTFQGQADAFTADEAILIGQLEPEIARQLGLLAATFEPGPGRSVGPSSVMMYFGSGGFRGQISGGAGCGAMHFPAGRRCAEEGMREVEPDADALDALDRLAELRELPVQWRDGSATLLSVELLEEPSHICGARSSVGRGNDELDVPLRVRVSTADGRVQLALLVHLGRYPGLTRDNWRLRSEVALPSSALSDGQKLDFAIPDGDLAEVSLSIDLVPGLAPSAMLDVASYAREPGAPPVDGLIDLMPEGRESWCYGTRTQLEQAATP